MWYDHPIQYELCVFQMNTLSTPPTTPTPSAKEVLRNLFNANAEGMSTFRMLYNLEVSATS